MNSNFSFDSIRNLGLPGRGLTRAFIFSLGLMLGACGGEGVSSNDGGENLPSPVAEGINDGDLIPGAPGQLPATLEELASLPVVAVSGRQIADPEVLIRLRASVSAVTGAEVVQTLWTQIEGPEVLIPDPFKLEQLVLGPDVDGAVLLRFRLTVVDSAGRVNSATISVMVEPVTEGPDDPPVEDIQLEQNIQFAQPGSFEIDIGESFANNLDATVVPRGIGAVTYTSSNPAIASVDGNGMVTGLAVGTVVITVTKAADRFYLEASDSYQLTVLVPPLIDQNIRFGNPGPVEVTLGVGYVNLLDTSGAPGSGALSYSSSNTAVATVAPNGSITTVGVGSTQITVLKAEDSVYNATSDTFTLVVIAPPPEPEPEPVLLPQPIQFIDPGPIGISPDTTYSNSFDPNFSPLSVEAPVFSSSNPSVATVDSVTGEVFALTEGTTIITVVVPGDTVYATGTASYVLSVSPNFSSFEESFALSLGVTGNTSNTATYRKQMPGSGSSSESAVNAEQLFLTSENHVTQSGFALENLAHKALVEFNGKLWVFDGSTSYEQIWSSVDGIHWQAYVLADSSLLSGLRLQAVVFSDELWLFNEEGNVWRSQDGLSWKQVQTDIRLPTSARLAVFDGKLWVYGGLESGTGTTLVLTSQDGEHWQEVTR